MAEKFLQLIQSLTDNQHLGQISVLHLLSIFSCQHMAACTKPLVQQLHLDQGSGLCTIQHSVPSSQLHDVPSSFHTGLDA